MRQYVWKVQFDHGWGSRGARHNSVWFFRNEPTAEWIQQNVTANLDNPALSVTRLIPGKSYSETTVHGV